MPNATVSGRTVRIDLKSCPGGWVELKQLTYDQMLERRDNATKMYMEQTGTGPVNENTAKINLQIANKWSVDYDFRNCIVDHNLENDKGEKLDLGNPLTRQILDPRVGIEIEEAIDGLNQPVDEDAFLPPRTSSSTNNQTPTNDTEES